MGSKELLDYLTKIEENRKKVISEEYFNWILDVLRRRNSFSDEEASYLQIESIDKENGAILSYLTNYLEKLATVQNKPNLADGCFESIKYYVHYKDIYFEYSLCVGQGAISYITCHLNNDFSEEKCISIPNF